MTQRFFLFHEFSSGAIVEKVQHPSKTWRILTRFAAHTFDLKEPEKAYDLYSCRLDTPLADLSSELQRYHISPRDIAINRALAWNPSSLIILQELSRHFSWRWFHNPVFLQRLPLHNKLQQQAWAEEQGLLTLPYFICRGRATEKSLKASWDNFLAQCQSFLGPESLLQGLIFKSFRGLKGQLVVPLNVEQAWRQAALCNALTDQDFLFQPSVAYKKTLRLLFLGEKALYCYEKENPTLLIPPESLWLKGELQGIIKTAQQWQKQGLHAFCLDFFIAPLKKEENQLIFNEINFTPGMENIAETKFELPNF
jgi:hypothetical protein